MSVHHRTDEGAFSLPELLHIKAAKQRYQEMQLDKARKALCPVPLLPAPPCAGLLPAPGHTSSPFTKERDRLLIGGVVYAVGEKHVISDIEDALVARRKILARKVEFAVGAKVRIRPGRTGTILRILTDGRCVVRINEMPFLAWGYYQQSELDITLDQEVIRVA